MRMRDLSELYVRECFRADRAKNERSKANRRGYPRFPDESKIWHEEFIACSYRAADIKKQLYRKLREELARMKKERRPRHERTDRQQD